MGAVLGTASCAASIACCCGSAACRLCCSACPSCKNSTSTRIVYSIFLLFTTIISCIMLVPKVEDQLQKINWLCGKAAKADCRELVGYIAVYRVSFGAVMFFLLLTVIMFGVKSSKDPRSGIQNGFWAIKFLVLIGIIVGAFFIPSKDGKFIQAWMYIGLIGAFLFILLQLVLLVDFVHSWNGAWLKKAEESDSIFWYFAFGSTTFAMFAASLAGIICMFVFFTNSPTSKCGAEKFVVSFQLVMSCVISFIALTPADESQMDLVCAVYGTECLLRVFENKFWIKCLAKFKPAFKFLYPDMLSNSSLERDYFKTLIAINELVIIASSVTILCLLQAAAISLYTTYLAWSAFSYSTTCNKLIAVSKTDFEPDVDAQSVIGVVITFFLVIFNCVRTSSSSQIDLNMTITNWYKPSVSNLNKLSSSDAAFWVKISSSWVCFGIYLWTLCAPVIFPNRYFS
ncbi:probable serine incorporator isoform X3 [Hydra vulgaris]|uniref:Probable serine incorporator isoform X3 n=1 Tax=Hydra vulgaris TaxID=6087 RepID=A0ABM4CRH2_HYDVU